MSSTIEEDKIAEEKYIAIRPPILRTLKRDDVHEFLVEYDRYYASVEEGADFMCPRDCVHTDLRNAIEFREEENMFKDDETLRAYLEPITKYERVDDILTALQSVHMDMSIKEIQDRKTCYDVEFIKVLKRSDVREFKEKIIVEIYVDGIRPEVVRRQLKAYQETHKDISLKSMMRMAEEKISNENEIHMQEIQIKKEKGDRKDRPAAPAAGKTGRGC